MYSPSPGWVRVKKQANGYSVGYLILVMQKMTADIQPVSVVPVPYRFPAVVLTSVVLIGVVFVLEPPIDLAVSTSGEWWRLFTSWIAHQNMWHVFVNVWLLSMFGWPLERTTGSGRTLIVFLGGCVLGNLFELVMASGPVIVLGASGGVYALVGVWLCWSIRRMFTPPGGTLFGLLVGFLVVTTVSHLFAANVAWWAHAGGIAWGALCQRWLRPEAHKPG